MEIKDERILNEWNFDDLVKGDTFLYGLYRTGVYMKTYSCGKASAINLKTGDIVTTIEGVVVKVSIKATICS